MSYRKELIPAKQRPVFWDDVKHLSGHAYKLACNGQFTKALRYADDEGKKQNGFGRIGKSKEELTREYRKKMRALKDSVRIRPLANKQIRNSRYAPAKNHTRPCANCSSLFTGPLQNIVCSAECRVMVAMGLNPATHKPREV